MKKTIYAIAALAFAFIGCTKEYNETFAPGDKLVIRAEVNDALTKVAADNAGSFSWQAGDAITILNTSGDAFNLTTATEGAAAAFTTDSFEGTLSTEAFYPAGSHKSGKFFLEPSFTWKDGETFMPMIGTVNTSTKKVSFKTAGSVIKLVCYNVADNARKLVVSSDTKKLSGEFTPSSGAIVAAAMGASDNAITINFAAGHPSTMVFYIPVPTGELGKLSFVMKDGSDAEISTSQTTKGSITMTRAHIVAAPALNCSLSTILWAEDFTGYAADYNWTDSNANGAIKTTSPYTGIAFGGANITYTTTDGNSTTKIYDATMAGGESPELLINKKGGSKPGGTFVVKNIPTDGASKMTLKFKSNNSIKVDATSGISVGSFETGSGEKTVVLTNTGSLSSFDLTFNNDYTSNCRIDDFVLSYSVNDISGEPTITPAASSITIAIASGSTNTGNTTFGYENALDSNPVVPMILEDKDWLTAVVTGSSSPYTLTVTAEKNTTGAARSATVRLRATGVYKDITINQPNALVENPSVSVSNEDRAFTATWSSVSDATSYLAYFGDTDNLEANPTSLTALTPSYDDGTSQWSVTKSGLTNGQTYYLYVKTDGVSSNYVSPSVYVKYTVKPVSNETPKTSTLTFEAKCSGSGTASDGAEWTVTSDGSESTFDSTKGIHYGTGSAAVTYIKLTTSDILGTISKVVVNASTASGVTATASVTVGGSAFGGDAQAISQTATDYTFNGSASGEIVVTVTKPSRATKALYVKSVVVTYVDN